MKTFEMLRERGGRPIAGEAKLEPVDGYVKGIPYHSLDKHFPYRDNDTIIIPHAAAVEIFPLEREWRQFMLIGCRPISSRKAFYFGGTDESPFLVRLNDRACPVLLNYISNDNPTGFYWEIAPHAPSATSDMKRQGDIFAFKLSYSLKGLKDFFLAFGMKLEMRKVEKEDIHIFGTRHVLVMGNYIEAKLDNHNIQTIVEGAKLVAPDHKDLTLPEGFHLLKQTRHLYNPKEAD